MITFEADWVIQDMLIIAVGIVITLFILKNEQHPAVTILEMICFCLLDAAVYENLATYMGLYGYGTSLIMIWNVPLTVPIVEFCVIYASLRLVNHMKLPTWSKPILVGTMGMLFDFTLDPVAIKEIFTTTAGTIGRWTWFIGVSDVNIYGEPVYNFTGWILLCAYGAAFLMLGRYWYKKSNYNPRVGFAYPVICMLGAFVMICLPSSQFLLWLAPFFTKGSIGEWIMLGVHLSIPAIILLFVWRGQMESGFNWNSEYPIFITLLGFHLSDIAFAFIGGFYEILWLEFLFTAIQWSIVLVIYHKGKAISISMDRVNEKIQTSEDLSSQ